MWLPALFTGWLTLCILGYIFLSWVRRQVRINDVTKKYIFITGCDSGFGHLLAQKLDLLGCHVFAACLTEAGQNKLKQVTSSRLQTLLLDVGSDKQVCRALDFVRSNLPADEGLWGLVNNAGILGTVLGPLEWTTMEDFEKVLNVNLMGTVRMTMSFLPLIKKAKGRIVSMSSISGRLSNFITIPYCLSKFGIEAFSDGLRPHLALYGVSVHLLEPGAFRTDITNREKFTALIDNGWKNCFLLTKQEFGQQYCENFKELVCEQMINGASPDVHKVVNAYVHALTARFPRTRYAVGWDARLFGIPRSYMPSMIQDMMFSQALKKLRPVGLQNDQH